MATIVENNVAHIVQRINVIWGKKPGKKTLQKLIFLMEEKGVALGFDYGLHFYGPYSRAVEAVTDFLSAEGIIEFDYSGQSHSMSVNNEEFQVMPSELSCEQQELIDELIEKFNGSSPSELELLTTAIYAYNHLEDKSGESVVKGVQKIKGEKYSREQIQSTMRELPYFGKSLLQ